MGGLCINSMMKNYNYIPFHIHSDHSLLDSCTNYKDYIDLAASHGMRSIAFTEHGKPLGWISKKLACDEAGIKYIHGVEAYLTERLDEKVRDNMHTVLLARNWDGVLELNSMISRSCDKEHFYYVNRLSIDEFLGLSENIIATSACLASPLNRLSETHPAFEKLIKRYDFLEIQPHIHPDQVNFNGKLLKWAEKYGKKLIAGTDTHSSTAYKGECRDILLASKRKNYGDEDAFDLTFKRHDELVEMFENQGALFKEVCLEALENTNLLSDMVEDFELDISIKYPILYGSPEADSTKLKEIVEQKFVDKLESGIIPSEQKESFITAIEEELRVFEKVGMSGFMLSTSELTSWCRKKGFALGTARGSVAGSRVAYIIDIIDLNPETWNTVFSRFCNEDRVEIGDVDIDCVEEDRPAIFNHIVNRFGVDKTARVAAFGTIQGKKAIEDTARALDIKWKAKSVEESPYSLAEVKKIKKVYSEDEHIARRNYPELFYYFDGLVGTKISQSVHPAGMVISPITLADNYGVFDKDGELCLMVDMDEAHEIGLAKYDFLILKTVQVIRDTCRDAGLKYPLTHEIDWYDNDVWESIAKNPSGIFQFESDFAASSIKRFKPKSIFDMSLVNACIRPSGTSYRNELLARQPNKNPSEIIDEILKDNKGYLVFQEDTIKFLQQICGFSGSEADNVRRAIGRKDKERLDKALPQILDGYCAKSSKSRAEAEVEAKDFLQIIEDSAEYQFGYNHSVAYCLLGYLCGYYRHYYPHEFINAYLNCAANDEDIITGGKIAKLYNITITMPKWGFSRGDYFFNKEKNVIAKGLASVKYMSYVIADELFELAKENTYTYFMDLLKDLDTKTSLDSRQREILIKIDFFSEFGNQRELIRLVDLFTQFKKGDAKQIKKSEVDGTPLEDIVKKYSVGVLKSGGEAKSYTLLDVMRILREAEVAIKDASIEDFSHITKVKNFYEIMGYAGYVSGKEEDRRRLYISDIYPVRRKKDGYQFGYSIVTKSIGSGKDGRFTITNAIYDRTPVKEGDIIYCRSFERDGIYYRLTAYDKIS